MTDETATEIAEKVAEHINLNISTNYEITWKVETSHIRLNPSYEE